jgi:hypothetical protein
MRRSIIFPGLVGLVLMTAANLNPASRPDMTSMAPKYLRVSVARWNLNTYTPEAERIFHQIETEGVAVFRAQPGFVRYRLMRADSATTVAVAEWETEELGRAGAEQYRDWMRRVGIMERIILETRAGDIVASSR